MNLKLKTILVMGAAGRLGRVICETLLMEGANVVAVEKELEAFSDWAKSANLLCLQGDITQVQSLQAVMEQAESHFGLLHGAVNTAYPRNQQYGKPFLDVRYEDFCENLALHLGGYFLFMQQCTAYALAKEAPFSLVNLSSIYGSMAPRFALYQDTTMTMPVEYAVIKAGIEHLASYVSAFSKKSLFRVNCVSPGGILAGQDEVFLKRYNSFCRHKGMLEPEDIVGTIVFLLSDASKYLCGQNIIADDGFHI